MDDKTNSTADVGRRDLLALGLALASRASRADK
ncbi:hypothetical protein ABIC66_000244 [Caulobacter sp. 1776]